MANETVLVLSGDGVPPWSARGITQTLEPIEAARVLRRTVNGALVDLSPSQFRKYRSVISCEDASPPAFDALDIGDTVTVDCVAELSYLTAQGSPPSSPTRTVVSGSSRVEGSYTVYRPRMTMMVVSKNQEQDEYGATVSWTLELEEV